jgi:hypothetical protein
LGNARLFQAEQRRTMELSTLLEVTQAVSSTLDLDQTLTLIAERMVGAVDVDFAFLSKPFTMEGLTRKIRIVLDTTDRS